LFSSCDYNLRNSDILDFFDLDDEVALQPKVKMTTNINRLFLTAKMTTPTSVKEPVFSLSAFFLHIRSRCPDGQFAWLNFPATSVSALQFLFARATLLQVEQC
jgi:hypothetical protein